VLVASTQPFVPQMPAPMPGMRGSIGPTPLPPQRPFEIGRTGPKPPMIPPERQIASSPVSQPPLRGHIPAVGFNEPTGAPANFGRGLY
jgi:hypothetical protein